MDNQELEKLKFYIDKYWNLINERNKTIILIIQLLIALLVIASFGEKIIPYSNLINLEILIIFLLFLIPIMLVDYLLQLNDGLNSLHQVLKFPKVKKEWYKQLIDGSNYIYTLITIVTIDVVIQLINQNFQVSLLIFLIQALFISIIIFSKRIKQSKYNF